jgi:hypothetical protein
MSVETRSNILIAGSGLELCGSEVVGLSRGSIVRASTAVEIYDQTYDSPAATAFLPEDTTFNFVGGYPRLPKGIDSIPYPKREGPLMQAWAITYGIPDEVTTEEGNSTSTITNCIYFARNLVSRVVTNPDSRDLGRFVNMDRKLGVVASRDHGRRIVSSLVKVGFMPEALVLLPTPEASRLYDHVSGAVHDLGMLTVHDGDIDRLLRVDHVLERVNDGVHYSVEHVSHGTHKVVGAARQTAGRAKDAVHRALTSVSR